MFLVTTFALGLVVIFVLGLGLDLAVVVLGFLVTFGLTVTFGLRVVFGFGLAIGMMPNPRLQLKV